MNKQGNFCFANKAELSPPFVDKDVIVFQIRRE
ncbi:hypothetical protein MHA_0788 [Mannheimia haemolytica PHL213]|nr:hypothetical protein MHA_0788 [Mannheimia haemolytica PHL213]